jgi:ribosomal protein L37AE/L43A
MPIVYVDEKGEKTDSKNASFAIITKIPVKIEKIVMCPHCKRKKKESEFVEIGVCTECDKKVKENSRSFRKRYEGKRVR